MNYLERIQKGFNLLYETYWTSTYKFAAGANYQGNFSLFIGGEGSTEQGFDTPDKMTKADTTIEGKGFPNSQVMFAESVEVLCRYEAILGADISDTDLAAVNLLWETALIIGFGTTTVNKGRLVRWPAAVGPKNTVAWSTNTAAAFKNINTQNTTENPAGIKKHKFPMRINASDEDPKVQFNIGRQVVVPAGPDIFISVGFWGVVAEPIITSGETPQEAQRIRQATRKAGAIRKAGRGR